jgi:hypothetical protein
MSPAARVRPETDQGNSLRDGLYSARDTGHAILTRYPFLAAPAEVLGCADAPTLTSLRLQRVEADALTLAMTRLADGGVPALPLHDALILRRSDASEGAAALQRAFEEVAGVCPAAAVQHG